MMRNGIAYQRFIPTGVGNTARSTRSGRVGSVHPHGCGEHAIPTISSWRVDGSSPRVWGTLLSHGKIPCRIRFIPTGVGNTAAQLREHRLAPVHPHGCGEHETVSISAAFFDGSSPRVWGTRVKEEPAKAQERFIPTGVGNTEAANTVGDGLQVHPHGCGEHSPVVCGPVASVGSSPRVWGTPQPLPRRCKQTRFIPTGVGNTPFIHPILTAGAVHPHGCGEHNHHFCLRGQFGGSSPRVWGTHFFHLSVSEAEKRGWIMHRISVETSCFTTKAAYNKIPLFSKNVFIF